MGVPDRARPTARWASSSAVIALRMPTEKPPILPVTFVAPMIVVLAGAETKALSGCLGIELRRAADAPRVEEAGAAAIVAVHVEAEDPRALDEEGPPLREERLEGAEIDDRGIGFDLAEVRVHRCRQREPRRDRILHVEAERGTRVDALDQRALAVGLGARHRQRCTARARAAWARRQARDHAARQTATRRPSCSWR